MPDNATKPNHEGKQTPPRVVFDLTPAMAKAVDRIERMTGLNSKPEVFRRAFTLLRIHVDAAARGQEIYMVDREHPNEKYFITLPFEVEPCDQVVDK